MRVGIGYDIHRLVSGRNLVLGGINIPFHKGLIGHSDADVLTHAIIDSLLGAAGLRDIGYYFPPDDPRYKDISSIHLLNQVNELVAKRGYKIENVDSTIIAEAPKLSKTIEEMQANICNALGIDKGQIMIKATTNEGLGHIGKGEAIAAYAIALLENKE